MLMLGDSSPQRTPTKCPKVPPPGDDREKPNRFMSPNRFCVDITTQEIHTYILQKKKGLKGFEGYNKRRMSM